MVTIIKNTKREINQKYVKMLVTGEKVTIAQAKEIIRRTDMFFLSSSDYYSGNNEEFSDKWKELSGKLKHNETNEKIDSKFDRLWGSLYLNYCYNDWASSSYIYGPCGWCNPNGSIFFSDNIGKWPTVDSVAQEWKILLTEFPFLKVNVTLYGNAQHYTRINPIVSMTVGNNKIVIHENHDIHDNKIIKKYKSRRKKRDFEDEENGLPFSWIEEYALMAQNVMKKLKLK